MQCDNPKGELLTLIDDFMLSICLEENDPAKIKNAIEVWRAARKGAKQGLPGIVESARAP